MPSPARNPLVRKLGPLPLWGWAALVLAGWFLFLRSPHTASGGASLPYTPAGGSGAQQPASGQGTPADNTNADLLNALLAGQKSSYDALLSALQYTTAAGASGAGGVPAGFGGGGGTSAFTAATVGEPLNNAPPSSYSLAGPAAAPAPDPVPPFDPSLAVAPQTYYVLPGPPDAPATYFAPSGWFQNEQGLPSIVTPPQLAPGERAVTGKAYAA